LTNDSTPTWDWNDVAGATKYRYGYAEGTWITESATVSDFTPSSDLSEGSYTLYVQAGDDAGNWSTSGSFLTAIDLTVPTATLYWANGSIIAHTDSIIIYFSESMNTSSLVISGYFGTNGTPVWSTTTYTNDTLTINPTTTWPTAGGNQTLTVDCNDLAGNGVAQISATYDVRGIIYVKTTGLDANPGTGASPKLTIANAITTANGLGAYTLKEVHVAAGSYNVTAYISMLSGISVYGGYNASDWRDRAYKTDAERANATYLTNVTYTGTTAGAAGNPTRAFDFAANCTATTILEGFTINGRAGGTASSAVSSNVATLGSPIIRYNTLNGGSAPTSYGVCLSNATSGTAWVMSNKIIGGTGATNRYGIYTGTTTTNPYIINNTITPNTGAGTGSYGIWNVGTQTKILNNTISNGGATTATCIHLPNGTTGANLHIINNILIAQAGTTKYGINEAGNNADPGRFENNHFYAYATFTAYYRDNNGTNINNLTTTVNNTPSNPTTATLGAWNNSVGDPLFVDFANGDWHLQSGSPIESTGQDLSATFTTDKDGNDRTDPWSIGAYELD